MDYAIIPEEISKEGTDSFSVKEKIDDSTQDDVNNKILNIIRKKKQTYEFITNEIVEDFAQVILDAYTENGILKNDGAIPIVKFAKGLQFKVYNSEALPCNALGNLIVVADYNYSIPDDERYLHNKLIIALHPSMPLEKSRFIIAHELGHYFLDFLGSTYERASIPSGTVRYAAPYKPNIGPYPIQSEKRADMFAASLLMPKRLFRQEYFKLLAQKYDTQFVLDYLSTYFNVSKTAVTRRIDEVIT